MLLSDGSFANLKFLCFVVAAAGALALPVSSQGAGWIADWNLSDNVDTDYLPENGGRPIACDAAGNIHMVWHQMTGGTNWDLFYRSLTDAGWSDPIRLTTSPAAAEDPTLVVEGDGDLHIFWEQSSAIYHMTFDGVGWGSPTRLTDPASNASCPSACIDPDGKIHLAWHDYRDGNFEIYHKCFDGIAWGADTRMTNDPAVSSHPCVATGDSGDVHLVWYDEREGWKDIYYKHFDGLAWGPDQVLSTDSVFAINPAVQVTTDGRVHVVWTDLRDGDYEVYHKIFDGISWGPDVRVTNTPGLAWNTSIAADTSNNLHLVWHDIRSGNTEIFYNKFDGVSWGTDWRLTYDAAKSKHPSIAVADNGDIHVVWTDERTGGVDIYWKWFIAGTTYAPVVSSVEPEFWSTGEAVPIGNLAGARFHRLAEVLLHKTGEPELAATDVVVEGPDKITCTISLAGAAEGYWDVVVRNIDGKTDTLAGALRVIWGPWGAAERLTTDADESYTSGANARCVAADASCNTHVVWYDGRDGDYEIYYKMFDGVSWGTDERLTTAASSSMEPSLAAGPGGSLHLVWDDFRDGDYEIYYKSKAGGTWGDDRRLTDSSGDSRNPAVAVDDSSNVYVVWDDRRGSYSGVYFKMFDGISWSPDTLIGSGAFDETTPAIDADESGNVRVAWHAAASGELDRIYYSSFDGTAWSAPTLLASGEDLSAPSLSCGPNGDVHVVWHDYLFEHAGQYDIFYKMFDGTEWDENRRITHTDGYSVDATVVAGDSGVVFVTWSDDRDGNTEIYFKRFNGLSWEADVRLTEAAGESRSPHPALDAEGRLHVVWWDGRDGNAEIYYKLRDPGAVSGIGEEGDTQVAPLPLSVVPNPILDEAGIMFTSPVASAPVVSVYDITGRLVWKQDATARLSRTYSIDWPRTDTSGRNIAPGVYFVRVDAGRRRATAKVIVLK